MPITLGSGVNSKSYCSQAPHFLAYVPDPIELEDHVPAHIPEHPEDLVPAEDEAPIEAYIPKMRAAVPSTYHSLLPSGTPPLLPIPVPSTSRRAEIPEADTPPQKRLLLTTPRPGCEVGESSAVARQPGPTKPVVDVRSRESLEFYSRHHDAQKDRAAVRAEIEVLRRERLAYKQESIQTREALAISEAYSRVLEARVAVLETQARHHEWQRQTADDFASVKFYGLPPASRRYRSFVLRKMVFAGGFVQLSVVNAFSPSGNQTSWDQLVFLILNNSETTLFRRTMYRADPWTIRDRALIDRGVAAAMAEAVARRVRNGYDSNGSRPRLAQAVRECTYSNFLKCQPLKFKGTEGVVGLTQWVEKYIGGLPDMIHDSVKVTRPITMQEAIEFATKLMDNRIRDVVENKRKFEAQEYMSKGCHVFLANIPSTKDEDKSKGKRLEDVPVVREFPEVFPEDLPGIPPTRQMEFRIDLVAGAAPVARHIGLAGYYRRFIEGFLKIAKLMTKLTQKKVKFEWGDKQEAAFQLLKQKLCSAPILALPEGSEDFIVYCDASIKGLGAVLMQREKDTERPDKRQRSGDRHQPTSQQSSHRSHGQNNDRHGSDRRGGNDNHRGSNNNNNYSSSNNRLNFKSIQLSPIHEHDPNTTI
uniref:Putative reverse transcriptase domain-containing protein n=1 Tax=Tanacetum cinerariifolium TaxID=118510 RepID=A0A6L2K193_TANCI|nr:putative reverse transcriptase domain-containing protein [Tanacetum cinerariifolium]